MEQKYGGDWNVDFEIVSKDAIFFKQKPDVVVNLVTHDDEVECFIEVAGWAIIRQNPPETIQTYVCSTSLGIKKSNQDVSATAAHEFIHAVGLGHTFNKKWDMMCSVEANQETCPGGTSGKSKTPSDLDLAGTAKLYGNDGFKIPNNRIAYGMKFAIDDNQNGGVPIQPTPKPTPSPTSNSIRIDGTNDYINYVSTSGKIQKIIPNKEIEALILVLDTTNDGYLALAIPRDILDAKMGNSDDVFYVLVDGEETIFAEERDLRERRIAVNLPKGARQVEIIGTQLYEDLVQPKIPPTTLPTPPKTPTIPDSLLGDYKVFESSQFGFSIEYPSDWLVDDEVISYDEGESIVAFSLDNSWTTWIYVNYGLNSPSMIGLTGNSYMNQIEKDLVEWCSAAKNYHEAHVTVELVELVQNHKLQ